MLAVQEEIILMRRKHLLFTPVGEGLAPPAGNDFAFRHIVRRKHLLRFIKVFEDS